MARPAKATQKSSLKTDPNVLVKRGETATWLGFQLRSWLGDGTRGRPAEARSGKRVFVFALGHRESRKIKSLLTVHLNKWQMTMLHENPAEMLNFQGALGPIWVIRPSLSSVVEGGIEKSPFARMRDLVGGTVTQLAPFMASKLVLEMIDLSLEEEKGALVGLEIASYLYAENCDNPRRQRRKLPQVLIAQASSALTQTEILAASKLGLCTNLARHLTNLPGGTLNPRTYSEAVAELFKKSQTVKVEIWQKDRLVKEQMNLLLAVGGAATEAPRFVHVRYRPRQKTNRRPVAIVGKGITFDSGGLDIKPSSAMRWMKKDMGGSAAAVAIAKWAELTELQVPLDIYLPMAENAIASASFRPGDIITARNGLTIEIHNTDAEGRLVLADALDVAVTQTGLDEPEAVINIATLTGAIKVGLGGEVAGLFCNRDDLANELLKAGQTRGDLAWRMPLYQPYKTLFRSTFADYANASDGFAGAITAALFLELFVRNKPWAHLDIYAWREGAGGAWSEAGGSGQPVQALSEFLIRR